MAQILVNKQPRLLAAPSSIFLCCLLYLAKWKRYRTTFLISKFFLCFSNKFLSQICCISVRLVKPKGRNDAVRSDAWWVNHVQAERVWNDVQVGSINSGQWIVIEVLYAPQAKFSDGYIYFIVGFENTSVSLIGHVSHSRILQHGVHCFAACDAVLLDQNLQSCIAAGNE